VNRIDLSRLDVKELDKYKGELMQVKIKKDPV
jgi:hypothetical protein